MKHLENPKKKIAIVYPYFAHYRLPVLQELMKSTSINYTLISDSDSGNDIKKINPDLANKSLANGGLRWKFVKNRWIYKEAVLWQSGLFKLLRKEKFGNFKLKCLNLISKKASFSPPSGLKLLFL